MFQDLTPLTGIEWFVVTAATAICLLGSMLPRLGNLLGRLFLGEDPLLARWRHQRIERKARVAATRQARKDARRARKVAAKMQKSGHT